MAGSEKKKEKPDDAEKSELIYFIRKINYY